jgi:hypothetical protein
VISAHRATKQLKLRSYRFQAVYQLQRRDTAARFSISIGVVFLHEGFHYVLNGALGLKPITLQIQLGLQTVDDNNSDFVIIMIQFNSIQFNSLF